MVRINVCVYIQIYLCIFEKNKRYTHTYICINVSVYTYMYTDINTYSILIGGCRIYRLSLQTS